MSVAPLSNRIFLKYCGEVKAEHEHLIPVHELVVVKKTNEVSHVPNEILIALAGN